MKIQEIFDRLHDAGLAESQVQFSRYWLGRSPRYYSHLVATQRQPGIATLSGLVWRIGNIADATDGGSGHQLLDLKHELDEYIVRRAITDVRRHGRGR